MLKDTDTELGKCNIFLSSLKEYEGDVDHEMDTNWTFRQIIETKGKADLEKWKEKKKEKQRIGYKA